MAPRDMDNPPIFDLHADLFMDLARRAERGEAGGLRERHLTRLSAGGVRGAVMADCRMAGEDAGPEHLERFIALTRRELAACGDSVLQVLRPGDIARARAEGKMAAIVAYEGLRATGGDLAWIHRLYDEAGMRVAALMHNDDNAYGGGARGGGGRGLTELGREAVGLMNGLGILIDLAHASRETRKDILASSTAPTMHSHTAAAAVFDNGRNLGEDEMRAIADKGGLIGCMTSAASIAAPGDTAHRTLERYMEHLLRLLRGAGVEHVGLGLHFCEYLYTPEQYPPVRGLESAARAGAIIEGLRAAGYGEDDIGKIAWGNFVRVFEAACAV